MQGTENRSADFVNSHNNCQPFIYIQTTFEKDIISHLFILLLGLKGMVLNEESKLTIVTASVDGMKTSASVSASNDLKLQGYLTYVGKSSMEVSIIGCHK